jgi:cytosine/adenosine deaminase-related metal-dependent hydrolase
MTTRAVPQPGEVNAHTHIYSALAPFGMPAPRETPRNFVEILERVWWRLDRALDERSLAASARLYAAEALLHGTTTLVDHHESPEFIAGSLDVLADACESLGIRALVCFGATERNGGRDEARRGLEECRRFARENRRARVRGLVGLHASFTVSDETAREAGLLCAELGTVMHVHVAEDVADVEDAKRRGFPGPLERLLDLGALPPGSIMAHGVHLDEAQVRLAESRGVWLVQNPRSNEGNRVGYPPALRASARVALGTDGYPADMAAEREALRRLAAEHAAEERGGAAAELRLPAGRRLVAERFGGAGDGGADTVERDAGGRVWRVIVDGETVVDGGRLVHGDVEEFRARARDEAARLWQRMERL